MKDKITHYAYMVLILWRLGRGTFIGGIALIAWIILVPWCTVRVPLTPPWHYIEKSKATGVVCVLQGKVGEETTSQGRITYTKPVGDEVNSYKAIAILPSGHSLRLDRSND